MSNLRKAIEEIQFRGDVRFDEPLRSHTSFNIGGPADAYVAPRSEDDVSAVMRLSGKYPVFILGSGANILVSDSGVRGIVLDMRHLDGMSVDGSTISAFAGAQISDVSQFAAKHGLSGLEFIYSMPGSVGGSVWMNARCYGKSMSAVLTGTDIIDEKGIPRSVTPKEEEFDYKISPFQRKLWAITRASFDLKKGDQRKMQIEMDGHRRDREAKGHFAAPSVGSIFKNDRRFGMPTGKLIDGLGLRGLKSGGARVSDAHANIIVNEGEATAGDVLKLILLIETRVRDTFGFELEREVRLVGDWRKEA